MHLRAAFWLTRGQNKCTAAQAATLLGKCSYIGTQLQGRVIRFAERALIERQYSKSGDTSVSDKLAACMQFIEGVFAQVPPNRVLLLGSDGPPRGHLF